MSETSLMPTRTLSRITVRPASTAVCCFALGILLHTAIPCRPQLLLGSAACVAALAILLRRHSLLNTFAVATVLTVLGCAMAQREHFQFAANDIGRFASDEPRLTELEVGITDDPQLVAGPPSAPYPFPPRQVTTATALRVRTLTGWAPVSGQLPVQINTPSPGIQMGQTVRMLGMLQRPREAANPGEFDWAAYYRQQRILANFTVHHAENIHILANPGPAAVAWLRSKTRHLLAAGFNAGASVDFAILDALVLGNRDPQLREVQDEFKQTGMAYQLSLSGLHIAVLVAVICWSCRLLRFRPRFTVLATTAFTLLFATIAVPSHSGVRAAILCVVFSTAILTGRSTDRVQFLSVATMAMLLWHPLDLYTPGFHLSFAVAAAFVFLLPAFQGWLNQQRNPDDLAKPQPAPPSLLQRALAKVGVVFLYGLIAWLATLPLAAYHFGAASTWSVLGSLLLFPVVITALLCGAGKIMLTLCWPRSASTWAAITDLPVRLLEAGVHRLGRLPGSSIPLPAPPLWLVVLYYALLLAPLLPHWSLLAGRRRWIVRLAPAVGVACIFSLGLIPPRKVITHNGLRVTLLSLGAGQCAVVEPPGQHPLLIDAGSSTVADVATKLIEPFLKSQGQAQVDRIFLSHGDFDHISAAAEIAQHFGVQQVFTSYHFIRNAAGNIPDQDLLDELERLNRSPTQICEGDRLELGNGAVIQVLWPAQSGDLNSNNAGLVLKLTYAGRSMLFPADIQDPAFAGVLQNASMLKADLLIAPHHGSSESLTPAFLAAVHPQYILSSNFWRLTSKQKRFEQLIGQIPLYRTPESGAITVDIARDGSISISTFLKGPRAGP